MLIGGKSPSEISAVLEIADKDDVWRLLTEQFKHDASYLTDQERKEILGMELLRLNALQAAVWDSAMMGDPASARIVLDTIRTRVRITGLEQVDPVVQKNLVLVMGEKEDDYIKALQRVAESE